MTTHTSEDRSGTSTPRLSRPLVTEPSSNTRVVLHVLFIIAAVALGLWTLHRLESVVVVLMVSTLFAYVIAPLVHVVQRPIVIAGRSRRLSGGPAIALVYVLLAVGASAGLAVLLPSATEQVNDIVERAPAYTQSIVAWERGWSRYYARLRIPPELRKSIDDSALAAGQGALVAARGSLLALVGALTYVPWLVLIPILAFLLLKDAGSLSSFVIKAMPRGKRARGQRLFEDLNATMAAYVRAQLVACMLVGGLCGVGLAVLGVPYPVLLGILAGVLEFIPLVGPLVVAIMAGVVGALHAPILALWAVAYLGVLRLVEDYVIYPRLIRHSMDLQPLAVILAVLAGAELDGVAGMFLAVPVVAMASVVFRHWQEWRGDDGAGA